MELIFETMAGLESVAAAELETAGLTPGPLLGGRLRSPLPQQSGCGPGDIVERLNRHLRCCDRIGVLLANAPVDSLAQIEAAAAEVAWADWLDPERPFAVRGLRRGRHSFRSVEVAGSVGSAVIETLRSRTGRRIPVDLDDPHQVIRAELFDQRLLLWIDTTGDAGLWTRRYRRYAHMASMRPTIANLLLAWSGWREGTLIDSFCGSGTILIEAAHRFLGTEAGALRGCGWAWQRTPSLAAEVARGKAGVRPVLCAAGSLPDLQGVERFRRHVVGALGNIEAAGLATAVRVHCGLARDTDSLLRPGCPLRTVVTNPPFGRRVGNTRQVRRLYAEAAQAWARAGVARVATWAEIVPAMHDALVAAGYCITGTVPVLYGRFPVTCLRAELSAC